MKVTVLLALTLGASAQQSLPQAVQVPVAVSCPKDIYRTCWDGTRLERDPTLNCEFRACPPQPAQAQPAPVSLNQAAEQLSQQYGQLHSQPQTQPPAPQPFGVPPQNNPLQQQLAQHLNQVVSQPAPGSQPSVMIPPLIGKPATPAATPAPPAIVPPPHTLPTPVGTCAGHCGTKDPKAGCWCDDSCMATNDCCPDRELVCKKTVALPAPAPYAAPPAFSGVSSVTKPATAPTANTFDAAVAAASSSLQGSIFSPSQFGQNAGGSCKGKCGLQAVTQGTSACWCDATCVKNNDCCNDYKIECAGGSAADTGISTVSTGSAMQPFAPNFQQTSGLAFMGNASPLSAGMALPSSGLLSQFSNFQSQLPAMFPQSQFPPNVAFGPSPPQLLQGYNFAGQSAFQYGPPPPQIPQQQQFFGVPQQQQQFGMLQQMQMQLPPQQQFFGMPQQQMQVPPMQPQFFGMSQQPMQMPPMQPQQPMQMPPMQPQQPMQMPPMQPQFFGQQQQVPQYPIYGTPPQQQQQAPSQQQFFGMPQQPQPQGMLPQQQQQGNGGGVMAPSPQSYGRR